MCGHLPDMHTHHIPKCGVVGIGFDIHLNSPVKCLEIKLVLHSVINVYISVDRTLHVKVLHCELTAPLWCLWITYQSHYLGGDGL